MNNLLPVAQNMLSKYREFYPYGGYVELDGQIRHVGVKDPTTEYPQSEEMIAALEKLFLEKASAYECKVTAIVCDVRVKVPGSDHKSDAIQVRLDHMEGYSWLTTKMEFLNLAPGRDMSVGAGYRIQADRRVCR
jgi:hypothetical protein